MAEDEGKDADCYPEGVKPPKWLVMIYLAGDNSLSANCIAILQELEAACYSEDVRVVACFDTNTPRPRGARYVEIGRQRRCPHPDIDWDLHNDLVPFECLPGHPVEAPDFCNPVPSSTPATTEPIAKEGLSRFIRFTLDRHPGAQKHMLMLFGHGSAVAGNTFLADSNPPSFLRLKELREVLARHFDAQFPPLFEEEDAADEDEDDDVDEGLEGEKVEELDPSEELEARDDDDARKAAKKRPVLDILACDNCMMNGIESAFEIRRRVKFIIGSQGLMLALGWPFKKILDEVVTYKDEDAECVARRILRVCARNLLDFALMDRSSDQSLCDLTVLRKGGDLMRAVRRLSRAMRRGLKVDDYCGNLKYPAVCDAIRLARLEAQSYWSETFVDLYDFCELLLERANHFLTTGHTLISQYLEERRAAAPKRAKGAKEDEVIDIRDVEPFKQFGEIAKACWDVLEALRANQIPDDPRRPFVLDSYYVGPELQYSNGVSIYFPWTLPEDPIIFEEVTDRGAGGSYGASWSAFERARERTEKRVREETLAEREGASGDKSKKPPTDYKLITAFDEYGRYDFARRKGGNWAAFLRVFFKATLRNVRRFDRRYIEPTDKREQLVRFFNVESIPEDDAHRFDSSPINLQKSSSDVDSENNCACPTIKNYPRRFYLSPADCKRRCPDLPKEKCVTLGDMDRKNCASYLGWNVRGITAEVIKPKQERPDPCRSVGHTQEKT